jgi:hypothetical protein
MKAAAVDIAHLPNCHYEMASAIEESAFFAPTEEALAGKADPSVALGRSPTTPVRCHLSRSFVMTIHVAAVAPPGLKESLFRHRRRGQFLRDNLPLAVAPFPGVGEQIFSTNSKGAASSEWRSSKRV